MVNRRYKSHSRKHRGGYDINMDSEGGLTSPAVQKEPLHAKVGEQLSNLRSKLGSMLGNLLNTDEDKETFMPTQTESSESPNSVIYGGKSKKRTRKHTRKHNSKSKKSSKVQRRRRTKSSRRSRKH